MPNTVPHDLKEIDDKILIALGVGRNVPSNLADELGVSRQWITQRLQQMESAGYVTNAGRGVYGLQPDRLPADDRERLGLDAPTAEQPEATPETPPVDTHAARHALDDLEAALEQGDRRETRAALQRARDALEDGED